MSSFRIAVCGGGMTMQAGIRAYRGNAQSHSEIN